MNQFKKIISTLLAALTIVTALPATTFALNRVTSADPAYNDYSAHTPRFKDTYITKESFDPARNELTYIVFELTEEADVRLDIFDRHNHKIDTILNDHIDADFYAIEWDGSGYEDREGDYRFTLQASNSRGNDTNTGTITIAEDDSSNRKPNIYQDHVGQMPFEPKHNSELAIIFKSELEADITVEIKDGHTVIRTITDELSMREGLHTVYWNGLDDDGRMADDGIYQYKITAANNKGKNVEIGNFSMEGAQSSYASTCAGFIDVDKNYEYCDAINFVEREQIFHGYADGSFKPNQAVNRAEAIKVILEAMDARILTDDGTSLGFRDTTRYAWYMPYIRTAMALGTFHGYADASARPSQPVTRAEALKILLETTRATKGLTIATHAYGQPYFDTPNNAATRWYMDYVWFAKIHDLTNNDYYFYPDSYMTRAELAYMIYRLDRAI